MTASVTSEGLYVYGNTVATGTKSASIETSQGSEAISPQIPVKVTVTPIGAWSARYVESRDTQGFTVGSASGVANVRFDWMACGRRKGFDSRPNVSIPDPTEERRIARRKLQALDR